MSSKHQPPPPPMASPFRFGFSFGLGFIFAQLVFAFVVGIAVTCIGGVSIAALRSSAQKRFIPAMAVEAEQSAPVVVVQPSPGPRRVAPTAAR